MTELKEGDRVFALATPTYSLGTTYEEPLGSAVHAGSVGTVYNEVPDSDGDIQVWWDDDPAGHERVAHFVDHRLVAPFVEPPDLGDMADIERFLTDG